MYRATQFEGGEDLGSVFVKMFLKALPHTKANLWHIQMEPFFFIPINIYIECLAKNLPIITIRRTIKMQAKINLS